MRLQPGGVVETSAGGVRVRKVYSTIRYFVGTVRRDWYPEMLEAIISDIPKGTPLTKSYIASIRKHWKRHQREEARD